MPGTTCLLIWGGALKGPDLDKVFDRFGKFESEGADAQLPPTAQPLQVSGFEAALLAGNSFDKDSDDLALAKTNLVIPDWTPEEDVKKLDKSEQKKRRSRDRELCKNLVISPYPDNRQKKFMEELLGKELASRTNLRFGFDSNAKEWECEDPLPLFLYFASRNKVSTAYCNSYNRNGMHQVDWESVPDAVDQWAFYKACRMLGITMNEKPSLILTMFVPPYNERTGMDGYDY